MFTPNGIAGAFALYANPGKPLGIIFWNEFVTVRSIFTINTGFGVG
jgi:hypothetical protein